MSFSGWRASLLTDVEIDFPDKSADEIIARHNLLPWFLYALTARKGRWYAWKGSLWLAKRLSSRARILETGCGCAWNLLWFAQHGFHNLYGTDIDTKAIEAGKEICQVAQATITLWPDDGLNPTQLPLVPFDAILAINWVYHVKSFDLFTFLSFYQSKLQPGGYIVVDLIDSAYDRVPNNQYLTSDWNKPELERGPTEYKKRYSPQEVHQTAAAAGFRVCTALTGFRDIIPRIVYIFMSRQGGGGE